MNTALLAGSPHFDELFTEPFKQLVCEVSSVKASKELSN
jgi:hypothetical protein